MTVEDVDKRVAEALEIFKTFLIQNIDKNVLDNISMKTSSLDKAYSEILSQIREQ